MSSTLTFSGRLSRISEISSNGDWVGWMVATISLGCGACLGFAGFFGLTTGACLEPTVTIGTDFAVLPFFLVGVTSLRGGFSVTGLGVGMGVGVVVALTMRPWLTTWFQPGPSLSCSADGFA